MPATVFTAKVVGTMSIGLWAGYNLSLVHSPLGGSVGKAMCHGYLRTHSHWRQLVSYILGLNGSEGKPAHSADHLSDNSGEESEEAARSSFSPRRVLDYTLRALRIFPLSVVASVANFAAYSAANRSGKHPYLLYLALGAPLVGILQFYGSRELRGQVDTKPTVVSLSGEDSEDFDEVNHSEVASGLGGSAYHHVASDSKPRSGSESNSAKPTFTLEHKYSILSSVVAGLSGFLYAISVIGLAGDTMRF